MRFESALQQIISEYNRASEAHAPFSSTHEGYAVIKEELDELWDAIKRNEKVTITRAEAKQVAAMALRFMIDLT